MKVISLFSTLCLVKSQSTGTQGEMTQVERLSKFQANDFILDVGINPKVVSKGDGGSIALLSAATLPAVRTHKIALAVISLEPCGVNRPHIHPRGTEAAYIVKGKNITMGFAPENGGKLIVNNVGAGFASFFPQGYIHFQANNDCEPALLVAGLNHDDPGTITVVTQFFALPDGTVEAATGSADMQARRLRGELDLGTAPNLMKECRKRCGLDKGPGPQPPNGGGGAPRIQLADVKGQKTETGGVIGCFGINGINPNRLKEILQLTPNIGVFFYTAENCVRNTRINDGKPPQTAIGPVAPEVANADVKSLRLVSVNGGSIPVKNFHESDLVQNVGNTQQRYRHGYQFDEYQY